MVRELRFQMNVVNIPPSASFRSQTHDAPPEINVGVLCLHWDSGRVEPLKNGHSSSPRINEAEDLSIACERE
jgi:hypothetical protein